MDIKISFFLTYKKQGERNITYYCSTIQYKEIKHKFMESNPASLMKKVKDTIQKLYEQGEG